MKDLFESVLFALLLVGLVVFACYLSTIVWGKEIPEAHKVQLRLVEKTVGGHTYVCLVYSHSCAILHSENCPCKKEQKRLVFPVWEYCPTNQPGIMLVDFANRDYNTTQCYVCDGWEAKEEGAK